MTIINIGKLLGSIIASFMDIPPERIVLDAETFDAPKDAGLYVLIIHDPLGNETVGIGQSFDYATEDETLARVSHERFAIELVSRGRAATDRYQEIHLALRSVMATQLAESNNVRFFRGGDPLNLTAIEGAGPLRRYRVPVIVSNVESKTVSASMIDKFPAVGAGANTKVEA